MTAPSTGPGIEHIGGPVRRVLQRAFELRTPQQRVHDAIAPAQRKVMDALFLQTSSAA